MPSNPSLAGWYDLGTRPGERGSAVVLGHVDSVGGPAVFARLGALRGGGAYDASRGGYQANVVVTARWVRTT